MLVQDSPILSIPRDERIRRRAYEIYLQRVGRGPASQDGSASQDPASLAMQDWLQAEQEVLREEEDLIDEASEESFPASDSPAY